MSSLAPLLLSVVGGGGGASAVAAARWVTDERARRRSEKAAATMQPLRQRSYELRIAEQADEVLQDTIKTLRENYAELKEQFAQYRRDTDERRQSDLAEHERQRTLDHEELDRLHQQVNDQSATISRLEFELQGYRSGSSP